MSNLGFEQALSRSKIPFARAPVGDRYVLETCSRRAGPRRRKLRALICLDKHTTATPSSPRSRAARTVRAEDDAGRGHGRRGVVSAAADQRSDSQRVRLARERRHPPRGAGRGRYARRIRPCPAASLRNEPVLRVMVEAREAVVAERCARDIAEVVARQRREPAAGAPRTKCVGIAHGESALEADTRRFESHSRCKEAEA